MKILNLCVTGQNIILQEPYTIISGSQNYLGLKVKFENDWEQYEKAYRFIWQGNAYTAVESSDGIVTVPHEVIKPPHFIVAVGGYNGTEFVPTAGIKIPVKENDYGEPNADIDTSEPVTAALLGQLLQAISSRVPEARKIAGINLHDDITKSEMLEALNAEDGAQVNVIEGVQVDGNNLIPDSNKKVNIDLSGKQNVLTFDDTPTADSTNPVTSGGVHSAVGGINTDLQGVKNRVIAIEEKIPAQATSQNKLADKEFVNSSIATETAHYISNNGQPFTNPASLPTDSSVTNNDYAFVTGTDSAGNTYYDRYKATVSGGAVSWGKEYRLNNSSFTAEQWSAITSGITALLVAQIGTNTAKLAGIEAGAQVNAIEGVQVNGTNLTPDSNKKVNITNIPKEALVSGVQTVIDNTDLAIRTAMYGEDLTPTDNSHFIFAAINGGTAYSISSKYLSVGEYAVSQLNNLTTHSTKLVYTLSDAGTLTPGDISVETGDKVRWDGSKWTIFTDTLLSGNLVIPYEYNGKPVQAIAVSGFQQTEITGVIIPGSIETINGWAFNKCDNLSAVTICSGVKTLATGAFAECPALATVTMPDSITSITGTTYVLGTAHPTVYCRKGSYAWEYFSIREKCISPEETGIYIKSAPTAIALAGSTEYYLTNVRILAFTFPSDTHWQALIVLSTAESGSLSISFPSGTTYVGNTPSFQNSETWEIRIINGFVTARRLSGN